MVRVHRIASAAAIAAALAALSVPFGEGPRPALLLPSAAAQCPGFLSYFGAPYEGDSIVWCIDKSGSMGWSDTIGTVKAEVGATLSQLSPSQHFGLIAFSDGTIQYSTAVIPATSLAVTSATNWVYALVADGSTCHSPAVIQALTMLEGGTGARTLILTSDGAPNCETAQQAIDDITAANTTGIPIHTVQAGGDLATAEFLEGLATQNGGTYRSLDLVVSFYPDIWRGDVDGDGAVTIADPIRILLTGFGVDCSPICTDAADATDDGIFEPISDAVTLLGALFVPGHPPLPAPTGACNMDPTIDGLPCAVAPCP